MGEKALNDETTENRRAINISLRAMRLLARLRAGEATKGDLLRVGWGASAVTHELDVLVRAKLVMVVMRHSMNRGGRPAHVYALTERGREFVESHVSPAGTVSVPVAT